MTTRIRGARAATFLLGSALVVFLGLSGGCDKGGGEASSDKEGSAEASKPAAAEAPAPEPKEAAGAAAAEPEEPKKSVPQIRREKLAAAAKAVYCAQRKDDGADIVAIYKAHGYDSPDAFNAAWEKDAKKKEEWAEATLASLTPQACEAQGGDE